jgi:hypothetical protein
MLRSVACRLREAVIHGEIDNTIEGRTTGRIWLRGRAEPLVLDLAGDCWRDLAGARLLFRNPAPAGEAAAELAPVQRGLIGDMTASRRTRVPADSAANAEFPQGEPSFSWKNLLSLEWFSESDGRVLIESADFDLVVSERQWSMDADEEDAQKLANLHAMRDYLGGAIQRMDRALGDDEFAWEERLRESERLTSAFIEVQEKYADDPDAELKEAFAMGWDGLLEAMAREDEGMADDPEEDGGWDGEADEEDADQEGEDDFPPPRHPLQQQAHQLVLRCVDLTRGDAHPAAAALRDALVQVSGKMAGALNGSAYEREAGFVLALLKRCLNWQNDALSACMALIAAAEDPDQRRAMQALRDAVLELREKTVNLRKELKGN